MAFNGLSHEVIEKYMKSPGGKPPPGVTPNRHNPQNMLLPVEHAVSILGLILATGFVAVRVYTRFFVVKKPGWDDCKLPNTIQLPITLTGFSQTFRFLHG